METFVVASIAELRAANLHVTANGAVNTQVTATLPAPGVGLCHCITSIQLEKFYAAVGVASATPNIITTTNLPGSAEWLAEQAAAALGTSRTIIHYQPTTPLRALLANIATTFIAPAQLQSIWLFNISYFTAPQ